MNQIIVFLGINGARKGIIFVQPASEICHFTVVTAKRTVGPVVGNLELFLTGWAMNLHNDTRWRSCYRMPSKNAKRPLGDVLEKSAGGLAVWALKEREGLNSSRFVQRRWHSQSSHNGGGPAFGQSTPIAPRHGRSCVRGDHFPRGESLPSEHNPSVHRIPEA